MKKTEIKDRILDLLNEENLTHSEFAKILGIQASGISHIISGRNKPSLDFIQKVLTSFKDINSNWLVLGLGSMYGETETPIQKTIDFDSLEGNKKTTASLLPKSNNSQGLNKDKENAVMPVNTSRQIKKIIVFYDNNTFEEFNHS